MKNIFTAGLVLASFASFAHAGNCSDAEKNYSNAKYNAAELQRRGDALQLKIDDIGEGYGWARILTSQEKFVEMIEKQNALVSMLLEEERRAIEALKILSACEVK
jgi:hypothetical protein